MLSPRPLSIPKRSEIVAGGRDRAEDRGTVDTPGLWAKEESASLAPRAAAQAARRPDLRSGINRRTTTEKPCKKRQQYVGKKRSPTPTNSVPIMSEPQHLVGQRNVEKICAAPSAATKTRKF